MNKIKQYFPGFFEGFKSEVNEFETTKDLLNIPWIKKWESDKNFYKWMLSGNALMAILENGQKGHVVGFIEASETIELPEWHKPPNIDREIIQDLITWLLRHESDIAHEINDFGELQTIFIAVIGRKAKK